MKSDVRQIFRSVPLHRRAHWAVVRWMRLVAGAILKSARRIEGDPYPMYIMNEPDNGSLRIGSFLLIKGDGVIWMEHDSGEGAGVPSATVASAIGTLFDKVY